MREAYRRNQEKASETICVASCYYIDIQLPTPDLQPPFVMDTVLSADSSVFLAIVSPGALLFALTVLLFGSAFTLCFLLRSKASVVRSLTSVLLVILFLMLGTVAIEFSAAATPSYTFGALESLSQALSTHRWLLFQLPILLTMTSLMVLVVYREHMAERHADVYRTAVVVSTTLSFASVLLIGVESMM